MDQLGNGEFNILSAINNIFIAKLTFSDFHTMHGPSYYANIVFLEIVYFKIKVKFFYSFVMVGERRMRSLIFSLRGKVAGREYRIPSST